MGYADLAVIVRGWLIQNVFPGAGADRVRVTVEKPEEIQHAARVVWVHKSPSSPGDAQPTLDVVDLDVDCYARTRDRAMDLGETVRAWLRYRLPRHTDPATGAFIRQVRALASPAETPWDSSATVRVSASYRLWVHHNPLA